MLVERPLYVILWTRSSAGTSKRSRTGMCHGGTATSSCCPMAISTNTGSVATRVRWNQHNLIHATRSSTETLSQQTPTELRNSSKATPSCCPMERSTYTRSVTARVRWNQHNENTNSVPTQKPDGLSQHNADRNPPEWCQHNIKEIEIKVEIEKDRKKGPPSAKGERNQGRRECLVKDTLRQRRNSTLAAWYTFTSFRSWGLAMYPPAGAIRVAERNGNGTPER